MSGWWYRFFPCVFVAPAREKRVEVAAEHNAHALCGGGGAYVVVLVVVAVVSLQAPCAAGCEQVFDVEVAYKLVCVQALVAVSEIAVEEQTVVEQSARQCHVYFHIREVAAVAAQIGRDAPVVAQFAQHARQARGNG